MVTYHLFIYGDISFIYLFIHSCMVTSHVFIWFILFHLYKVIFYLVIHFFVYLHGELPFFIYLFIYVSIVTSDLFICLFVYVLWLIYLFINLCMVTSLYLFIYLWWPLIYLFIMNLVLLAFLSCPGTVLVLRNLGCETVFNSTQCLHRNAWNRTSTSPYICIAWCNSIFTSRRIWLIQSVECEDSQWIMNCRGYGSSRVFILGTVTVLHWMAWEKSRRTLVSITGFVVEIWTRHPRLRNRRV